ncbi:MAG TPA: HlyD family secretion protein [Acetobacteraceae bacterium]|nr:HlyD family secretion protein [Acetobacteraceae bacterium]
MADAVAEARRPAADQRQAVARREPDERTQVPVRRRSRRVLRYSLFSLGAAVLIVGGLWYYLTGGRYVTTDDAYVQANVLTVSTDVSGIVDRIPVYEGEHVAKGQVLFRLDPDKFQIALDNARANLDQTALTLQSLKADYLRAERQVAAQQAIVQNDQDNYDRYAALVKRGAVTQQEVGDARYKLLADQAMLGGNQANVKSVLMRLGGNADTPIQQMPSYRQAQAQLAEAEREYRHSIVRAPFAGVVTQVNKLQPGQFLAAGTAAFGLVQTSGMWVAAEPKETALTYARPGQAATVTVDTYPGETWHGTVESIARATDQEFSVLPAQNSSGNWVKVVQRVPVRIDIKPDPHQPPLSAGMSAEVSIDTHHHRTLADFF